MQVNHPVSFLNLFFLLISFPLFIFSQNYKFDPLHPPDTYKNSDNPQYWKNRMPFPGYWQQDVHYAIKADLNEKTDIISGSLRLTYLNNSPDTLTFVFFHLYQNAFQPGSYYDKLQEANGVKPDYGKYEESGFGTQVQKLLVSGKKVKSELDNTILKVWLPKPLLSGDSVVFEIDFKSWFDTGSTRRRMKAFKTFGYTHYDGVHWYPRISVYDRKFGWDTDQHLGHEFYGDFGTYDVELNLANNFIMEATGELQNRKEVLPDTLRKKLDIVNFKDKPLNSPPSVIIPYDSTKRKTWIYHAENVHDFAFTADPTYRIGESEWKGIKCIALAQEPHASKWQNAADYTAKVIQVYSEDIGMYIYHKMIVADARDGMEYPMLTLDGGLDPGYRGLFAHEIGHNWFFGQVGNNETYRAALDEGFTQFLTAWCYERIDGKTLVKDEPADFYTAMFKRPEYVRDNRVFYPYIQDAAYGTEVTLNTHSDDFNSALGHEGGYRQVYYKTASMLYNLQYVLGDELFLKAMQHYFDQWKVCHPYFEDFRNSIIQFTTIDLNWFFDQWLETSKTIDYEVECVKRSKDTSAVQSKSEKLFHYTITLKREGSMQMPLDLMVLGKDGKTYNYYIPNTWFVKKTNATVLPKWIGWGKLNDVYKAQVSLPTKIRDVIIDPSERLADIYSPDNSKKYRVKYYFDSRVRNPKDWRNYEVFGRPDFWYNGYDGLKAGIHVHGGFLDLRDKFHFSMWFNTGLGQNISSEINKNKYDPFSFRFGYSTPVNQFSRNSNVYLSAQYLDGLNCYTGGFEKWDRRKENRINIFLKSGFRADSNAVNYLLYPELWKPGAFNNTVNLAYEHLYKYKRGRGDILLELQSAAIASDYDRSKIGLTVKNENDLRKINIRTRTILQYSTGRNQPPEGRLFFAGAAPEELMGNKYTRSAGIFPTDWTEYGPTTNHFHYGGGLNMRGFAGYLVPVETNTGEIRYAYTGDAGAALNIEIELTELMPSFSKYQDYSWDRKKEMVGYDIYLFGDAGIINYNYYYEKLAFGQPRFDGGLGLALSINRWGPIEEVDPLIIRFDIPFYLYPVPAINTAEPYNPDYSPTWNEVLKFRWLIGVGRAF